MTVKPLIQGRALTLLNRSLAMFDHQWDEAAGMVLMEEDGIRFHSSRDTAFYALGLLERGREEDIARACQCIRAVLACQIQADGEIFDGTFRSMQEQGEPVRGKLNWQEMDLVTHYNLDIYYERLCSALRARVQNDSELRSHAHALDSALRDALKDIYPVVWDTYDPNWREFIVSTFMLILLYYEDCLPASLAEEMDRACRRAVRAAVLRAQTAFTPLNTNIRVMHVLICDWFGERWHDSTLRRHAEQYAQELLLSYRVHHAVPEFNSPTYNGVVFTFITFWRTVSSSAVLHQLGHELEDGLWRDFAEFYNPAMHNICGPYSRAYELEMTVHTAIPSILYVAGVDQELPPLSIESDCDPGLALAQIAIPADVIPLLQNSRGERTVTHQFEELAERGDPRCNHALCTTSAWITDDLMIGAMSGSRNTSYQLHPAVIFWKNGQGTLSTIKLLRRDALGKLAHIHTVFFDLDASSHTLSGTIRACADQDILPYFEIETPNPDDAQIQPGHWQIGNLSVEIDASFAQGTPADTRVEQISGGLRVFFPMKDGSELHLRMIFSLQA